MAINQNEGANTEWGTIAYETCKKEKVVILNDELRFTKWITINHMAQPVGIINHIQSSRFEQVLMKGTQYTINNVTPYVREFVFNLETIYNNGKVLHDYDIKEIPLYDNQEDHCRDPEIIDSFFGGFQPAPKVPTLQLSQNGLYQTQGRLPQLPC